MDVSFLHRQTEQEIRKELIENTAAFESFLIESVDKMYTLRISNGHDLFLKNSITNTLHLQGIRVSLRITNDFRQHFHRKCCSLLTLLLKGFGTTLILQGRNHHRRTLLVLRHRRFLYRPQQPHHHQPAVSKCQNRRNDSLKSWTCQHRKYVIPIPHTSPMMTSSYSR